jgi:hypothetical protein
MKKDAALFENELLFDRIARGDVQEIAVVAPFSADSNPGG